MIKINMDLVPFGDKDLTRNIGTIKIANDGTGTQNIGNYKYTLDDGESKIKGELKDFKRLERSSFHLLRDVLNKALVKEADTP